MGTISDNSVPQNRRSPLSALQQTESKRIKRMDDQTCRNFRAEDFDAEFLSLFGFSLLSQCLRVGIQDLSHRRVF
jgi:hypothetical protein